MFQEVVRRTPVEKYLLKMKGLFTSVHPPLSFPFRSSAVLQVGHYTTVFLCL